MVFQSLLRSKESTSCFLLDLLTSCSKEVLSVSLVETLERHLYHVLTWHLARLSVTQVCCHSWVFFCCSLFGLPVCVPSHCDYHDLERNGEIINTVPVLSTFYLSNHRDWTLLIDSATLCHFLLYPVYNTVPPTTAKCLNNLYFVIMALLLIYLASCL